MKNNFILRAITGIIFVVVLVGCIIFNEFSFGLLFLLVSILTVRELAILVNAMPGVDVNKNITSLGAAYLFLAFFAFCSGVYGAAVFIPYLVLLLYLFISELYLQKANPILNWAFAMFSQLYVALPFALLNVLAFTSEEYNFLLPLSVFIFLWLSDSGAYCVGSLIGKHRLFERISPKKSWEGSIGGAVVCVIAAIVLSYFFTDLTMLQWIGLAVTVVVFGTWGDLTESLLKRQLQIKDSGTFLPGHGGLLDRFDSALMAIPAAVIYLYFFCM